MHHDVKYNLEDPGAAQAQAMQDVKGWLGNRFSSIENLLKVEIERGIDFDQFEMMVSFTGIQGYPVKVWWETLHQ